MIALFLLYVALLPAPPLPHAVHQVLRTLTPSASGPSTPGSPWILAGLRKLPEAALYGLLALFLTDRPRLRLPIFLSIAAYGLMLELMRLLHPGRTFEPYDVLFEAIAALLGSLLDGVLWRRTSAHAAD